MTWRKRCVQATYPLRRSIQLTTTKNKGKKEKDTKPGGIIVTNRLLATSRDRLMEYKLLYVFGGEGEKMGVATYSKF